MRGHLSVGKLMAFTLTESPILAFGCNKGLGLIQKFFQKAG